MSWVILNAISFIMVHILKFIEYKNDYIIIEDRYSLLFMSLHAIYMSGIGRPPKIKTL